MMRPMSYRALNEARWIIGVLAVCWLATMVLLPLVSVVLALAIPSAFRPRTSRWPSRRRMA
jgi:ABC-type Fe3+ transport system permease subunit